MTEGYFINVNKRKQEYEDYLDSEHWKCLRRIVLDKFPMCQVCEKELACHVHHRVYKSFYDVTPDELMSICQPYHSSVHRLIDTGKLRSSSNSADIRKLLYPAKKTCVEARNKKTKKVKTESGTLVSVEMARLWKLPELEGKRIPHERWLKLTALSGKPEPKPKSREELRAEIRIVNKINARLMREKNILEKAERKMTLATHAVRWQHAPTEGKRIIRFQSGAQGESAVYA